MENLLVVFTSDACINLLLPRIHMLCSLIRAQRSLININRDGKLNIIEGESEITMRKLQSCS